MHCRIPVDDRIRYFTSDRELEAYVNQSLQRLQTEFQRRAHLQGPVGRGNYGTVYSINDSAVVKFVRMRRVAKNNMLIDFDITKRLAQVGITVPLYETWLQSVEYKSFQYTEGFMIMGRGHPMREWTQKKHVYQVFEKIVKMARMGIFCADVKPANTVLYRNEVHLIDFDHLFCHEDDFSAFLRTLKRVLEEYSKTTASLRNVLQLIEQPNWFEQLCATHAIEPVDDDSMKVALLLCIMFSHMINSEQLSIKMFKDVWLR